MRPGRICTAIGMAVALSVAGCGGEGDSSTATGASSPSANRDVAFAKYEKAARPFECSDAYGAMGDASKAGDIGLMKDKAREYRDVIAKFDAQLGQIDFPPPAKPIVVRMRERLAAELNGLTQLTAYDGKDETRKVTARNQLEADDAKVTVEGNQLREMLGHPESAFGVAADQLDAADAALFRDLVQPSAKFKEAIATDDLAGAKAANAMEVEVLQRYIDELGAIDWPPGSFRGQAESIADHIRGQIEFDQRQTEVATAAQIVRAPEEGTPEWNAARAEYDALWNVLVQTNQIARPDSKC